MKMDAKKSVIVSGVLCLDIIPGLNKLSSQDFYDLFRPGRVLMANGTNFSTGGAVANTGIALHKLGIRTRLLAKIGNDYFGQVLLNLLKDYSSELISDISIDKNFPTPYTIIISPPGIDRIFIHCPGINDHFTSKDVSKESIGSASLFHFGYPPVMKQFYQDGGDNLEKIFEQAKSLNLTTSLDMSLPDPSSESGKIDWKSILKRVLPYVDIFAPSFEELIYFFRKDLFNHLTVNGSLINQITPEILRSISDEIIQLGTGIVLIKLGSNGLFFRSNNISNLRRMGKAIPECLEDWANKELWSPCFMVDVVGTTGSGDTTVAGFLSALLRGLTPEEAVTTAVAVGACSVEASDSISGLRSWDEIQTRIQGGWRRLPTKFSLN